MIAQKYLDFDVFAVNARNHIDADWQRLRIDEGQKAEMLIAFINWTALFYQYRDASKRTPIITEQTKTAYQDLNNRLRGMVQQVKNDRAIALTDADRKALGITPRKPYRTLPRPSQAPMNEVSATALGKVTFTTTNTIDGGVKHTRPTDVDRIGRAVAYTENNAPPPIRTAYKTITDSRSMQFTLPTPPNQTGYLITWFVNHRGESGPPSEPLKFSTL